MWLIVSFDDAAHRFKKRRDREVLMRSLPSSEPVAAVCLFGSIA